MQRLIIVYNPNSSKYIHVRDEVLASLSQLKSTMIGKFAIKKAPFEDNLRELKKVLKDEDLVIAAGGDATAAVTANAILESDKDVTLAALPYGNFNDLARTLGTMKFDDIRVEATGINTLRGFRSAAARGLAREPRGDGSERRDPKSINSVARRLYPLDIIVDGKHWRYATCYVTIGMMAEAVELFDEPKIRKKMKKGHRSSWRSYLQLAKWYFRNRHKKVFLPEFTLNGKSVRRRASDYVAVNGHSISRVMKGGNDYLDPQAFRSTVEKTISFPRLFTFMAKSILSQVPGDKTTGDLIEFLKPTKVELQAEGEYKIFENVHKIEIRKPKKCLKVVHKN